MFKLKRLRVRADHCVTYGSLYDIGVLVYYYPWWLVKLFAPKIETARLSFDFDFKLINFSTSKEFSDREKDLIEGYALFAVIAKIQKLKNEIN